MKLLTVASLTFRETIRKKALLGAGVLTLGFLVLYATGLHFAYQDLPSRNPLVREALSAELLVLGLYALSNIAALLAILFVSIIAVVLSAAWLSTRGD